MPKSPIEKTKLQPAVLTSLNLDRNEYKISHERECTIGRSLTSMIVILRPSTSRDHAKIRPQNEGYFIYDLMSRSGTFVNGERVMHSILKNGDIIAIGKEEFIFKTLQY